MSKNQIQLQNQFLSLLAKDPKSKQLLSTDIDRMLSLGLNMKVVLMQPDGIKVVQQMLKIVKKMNITTFLYMQHVDNLLEKFKRKVNEPLDDSDQFFQFSPKKTTQKQKNSENVQSRRDKMIQTIVEQLYNARQDSLKIEQIDQRFTFSNGQQITSKSESESKQLGKGNQKQLQQSRNEISELKRTLMKYQQQSKAHKRMIQQSTKSCLEKDEKIQNLKNTISKLEQVVIKQFKIQGQPELRLSSSQVSSSQKSNQSSLIKSDALQKQNVQLKQEIQTLRQNLAQSVGFQPSLKRQSEKERTLQKMKMKQFLKISRQYVIIKEQINNTKGDENEIDSLEDSGHSQFQNQNNEVNMKVQFQILNEKYNTLNKLYNSLKEQNDRSTKKHIGVMKRESVYSNSISSPYLGRENGERKKQKSSKNESKTDERRNKTKESANKLEFGSDEQQIIRDIRQINKMEKINTIGVTSFESIINAKQMGNKIQGFQYNNSFIYKVNSTKFIQTFQAKLALVLEYVCILELYFSRAFLSCVREELMMENEITIKQITSADLSTTYYIEQATSQQNNSFNINSSKISSMSSPNAGSQKIQFSINQQLNNNSCKLNEDLADSFASMPVSPVHNSHRQITKKKIEVLEKQLSQVSSLITDEYLNPHELRDDREFLDRVQRLKSNRIAVMVTNVVKQNDVFKKCINQMIKSEQSTTKENNEIYFEEGGVRRKVSIGERKGEKGQVQDKDKQNCIVM